MANQLDPKRLEGTFEHLEAWLMAQGLCDAVTGELLEPVNPEEVVEIVRQYEGMVKPEPFVRVVVGEPLLVDRRKRVLVS